MENPAVAAADAPASPVGAAGARALTQQPQQPQQPQQYCHFKLLDAWDPNGSPLDRE